MTWTSLVRNPEGITSVYGGAVPPLTGVRIHSVVLDRDGPQLRVRFDLCEYPEAAPKKWAAQRFNTVQVELSFGGLDDVELRGFSVDPVGDILLTGGARLSLEVMSADVQVRASAQSAYISDLSAYADVPQGLEDRQGEQADRGAQ
ncbi:Imm50 family immunity protein [Streptomyces sp. NPDC004732]|uniref:Imm50 family immunity protein n=1 Tax=Streptomyces sp. NPDC004732 TaxID=3154290 RepID=UPI00339F6733